MEQGLVAYSQAVRHHSLVLSSLRKEVDNLKLCNTSKDTIIESQGKTISELKEVNAKILSDIQELKENLGDLLNLKAVIEQRLEREVNKNQPHTDECQPAEPQVVSEQQIADASAAREQMSPDQKNALDKDLFDVAASGCVRDVQTLLKRGAGVNSRHKDEKTPLVNAAENGTSEVVHTLISWGALIDTRAKDGYTALILASKEGHLAVVEMLITQGAVVNLRTTNHQDTALIWSANQGHAEVCEVLIAQGANINAQSSQGYSAVHIASLCNRSKAVECLIRLGANLNLKTNDGKTALSTAREKGHADIVRQLQAAGAQG